MLGMAHGQKQRKARMSGAFLNQCDPDELSKTVWRVFHVGHKHKIEADSDGGILYRMIPSLAGTDAYHSKNLFFNSFRSGEAFVYHVNKGPCGYHRSLLNPRTGRPERN